ncbi:MAG: S-layer homology domain-containing protein [Chloroflexia bacterium]
MYVTGTAKQQRRFIIPAAVMGLCVVLLALIVTGGPERPISAAHAVGQGGGAGAAPHVGSTSLVVSQVYGGGGNSGATYTNDFIEVFNLSNTPVTMNNWSVQYAPATSNVWQVTTLTGTITIQPWRYLLVQEASGGAVGQPLPTPDVIGGINMSATTGKVALVNNNIQLSGTCPSGANIVDFVGYGLSATCSEFSPAPPPSNTTADIRNGGGCTDTDNNAADFTAATPTPRNSASPANICGTVSTPTPAGPTSTATATVTPGGPTSTPTATPPPVGGGTVKLYMLYAYGLTTATPQPDEAVRLINTGTATASVGGWQIQNETGGLITLPMTATIPAGGKIWIADTASGFRTYFGFNPDYEYGADTDPAVPQASATAGYTFANTGGSVQLLDNTSAGQDTLVYGTGNTGTPGWSGQAVQYYTFFPVTADGLIFYRKLDQATERPVTDTDTKDDWAQDNDPAGGTPTPGRENDDINGKKLLRPGWALTDPANEDMFFTKVYTEANVTTEFMVAPDNTFDPVHNLLIQATQSISIETYEWHAAPLVFDIIAAHNRGVNVSIVIDGNPCCNQLPDDETLWSAQQWEGAGIPVYFFSGTPATGNDEYRYNNTHAKFMIVDDTWLATGSENFSLSGMPNDPKANGTYGNRGSFVITNAPQTVAYAKRLRNFDFQPGKYLDLVRWNTAPGFGTPGPTFTPTLNSPDYTSYQPVKPTPLVVTETERIEIVQSPDNELRDQDSLLGLVNSAGAGDEVEVEQQYERTYWQTSPTVGPNPRLEAYIAAARRGANVRIMLDSFFDYNNCSPTHNVATVAYVNGMGLANLQAKMGAPSGGEIHNKLVLVRHGGIGTVHTTSINGSENASKNNREIGLQITSNAGYQYFKDVFDYDWSVGYVGPCTTTATPTFTPVLGTATATVTPGGPTATATVTPGGPTFTPTQTVTPTPIQTPACNYLLNGDFETGSMAPWATTTPGITATVVTTPVNGGMYAISVTSVFTAGNGGSQGIQQDMTNIVAGASYYVGAAVLRSATNIQSARIRITWYPCTTPGTCSGTNADMFLGNNGPNWQYVTMNMTAPANTLSARYKAVFYTSDGNPATIYFDDLVFDCNGNGTATPTPGGATATVTVTPQPPTVTVTATAAPPSVTATATAVPPTATMTASATPLPATVLPSPTVTPLPATVLPSPTVTPLPATVLPTPTITPLPATVLPSPTVTQPPATVLPSATVTPLPATVLPSVTATPLPATVLPSATATVVPPSVTATRSPGISPTPTQPAVTTPTDTPTQPPIATATPTQPPGPTPTATRPPAPTETPTATATVCVITFSDVHPSDYFYTSVTYLYCHGVVSGYNDGTFRPYNTTTRSQMVKIVVLGFNKPITTPGGGAHTFTDVPPSNPFFPVVETAAADGIVSGYRCGAAPAGPCDSINRPYFLPYNSVTRGQLSKIDVIAAGWALYNPAVPTFTDVPRGSTFYTVIETAVCHGIVSGYSDGTFRPYNNATRGQISKIVYLSIVNPPASCGPPR